MRDAVGERVRWPSSAWIPVMQSTVGASGRTPFADSSQSAPEELAELESAASALQRTGLEERAGTLREFATKVRATLRTESLALLESELEALVQAEGLAMRAGRGPGSTRACSPPCAKRSRRAGWWSSGTSRNQPASKAVSESGRWAPLRKPRVPRRIERLARGAAALASRERERASHQRGDLRAGSGIRFGAVREALIRDVPGEPRRGRPPLRRGRGPRRLDVHLPP